MPNTVPINSEYRVLLVFGIVRDVVIISGRSSGEFRQPVQSFAILCARPFVALSQAGQLIASQHRKS